MQNFSSIIDSELMSPKFEQQGIDCAHVNFSDVHHLQKSVAELVNSSVAIVPGCPRKLPEYFRTSCLAFLELRGCNKVRQYNPEDQVITVESGMTCQQMDEILSEKKQWLPIQAANPNTTLMEVVSRGNGGCIQHSFGGPRDLVLGLELSLATGQLVRYGGRVVKNVAGYNMSKLFIGSQSSLGIITAIDLRLFARPQIQLGLIWHGQYKDLFAVQRQLTQEGIKIACMELVSAQMLKKISNQLVEPVSEGEYLIIQIHGDDRQVKQACNRLKALLSLYEFVGTVDDQNLWCKLADLSCENSMEISMDISALKKIYEKILRKSVWQARASRGWLRLIAESREQLNNIVEQLSQLAKENTTKITVAYMDNQFEYRVRRLPEEDVEINKLKQAIKLHYDPNGCLNPLVCL